MCMGGLVGGLFGWLIAWVGLCMSIWVLWYFGVWVGGSSPFH